MDRWIDRFSAVTIGWRQLSSDHPASVLMYSVLVFSYHRLSGGEITFVARSLRAGTMKTVPKPRKSNTDSVLMLLIS